MVDRLRKSRGEEGFTLIELLIVIIILGILAAIVVFAVGGITDRGKKSACKADFATLATAQEAKFAKDGSYAANAGALVPTYLHNAPTATLADNGYTVTTDNTGAVTVTTGAGSNTSVAQCNTIA